MAMTPSPLRALIVDDEAPALSELVRLLGEDARIGAVRTADSRAQALEALERESVDVLLCDISMPGLDGAQLARVLARLDHRPHLIFTTAPAEVNPAPRHTSPIAPGPLATGPLAPGVSAAGASRPGALTQGTPASGAPALRRPWNSRAQTSAAVRPRNPRTSARQRPGANQRRGDSMDLQGVDYVPKPVRPDQLAEAIRRAMESAQDETIAVELAGVTRYVRRSQVLYVEAQGDYARLHTATGSHLIRIPLTTLEERWSAVGFLRIHRSTMVALPHVDEVLLDGGRFQLRLGNRMLQVSRRHTRQLRDLLLRGTGLDGDG
jgi:DNA-binding LytR/AlgR family response regulator